MLTPWVHIIGAGVSGLSLAVALAQRGSLPGDVLISDPYLDQDRSQTFCFWYKESERELLKPERSWNQWSFSTTGLSSTPLSHLHIGEDYQYGMVSGDAFRRRSLKLLKSHPQVRFSKERVTHREQGPHVFDSRPLHRDSYYIQQSFVGFELRCQHDYPLNRVALMEEMTHDFGGLRFKYVLPLSQDRLLIEYTVFTIAKLSLDDLEAFGQEALEQESLGDWVIERVERAHIPMGIKQSNQISHLGIPIGTRAGMARDSTGYGFVEMHKWAQEAANTLIDRNVALRFKTPRIRSWMDSCLLKLIEHRPELTPELFMTLATKLSGDRFASFMMSCHLSDASQMMLVSPKRPFIMAALGKTEWI